MDFFHQDNQPDTRLNITVKDLRLRLTNPPAWIEKSKSLHLLDELHQSGYFRTEVRQTQTLARQKYYLKKWYPFEYPLIAVLLACLFCYYTFITKDIERFYFVAKQL